LVAHEVGCAYLGVMRAVRLEQHRIAASGAFPNNERLPVLIYRDAVTGAEKDALAVRFEQTFAANAWTASWRDVVYEQHHFHSTAHEVLGCFTGRARLQLGGPTGPSCELHPGDVLVLPAGVAHRCVKRSINFRVVGAYAGGRPYDMVYGKGQQPPSIEQAIESVPLPARDPVYGVRGPLRARWV
jgi:uncharacterized protein YjlB